MAVLATALVVSVPSAAYADPLEFPPPGGPSEVQLVANLPVCPANVGSLTFDDEKNGIGLGWSGQWNVGFLGSEGRFWQISNFLPCQNSAGRLSGITARVQLTGATLTPLGSNYASWAVAQCVTVDGVRFSVEAPRFEGTVGGGGSLHVPNWGPRVPEYDPHPVHGRCLRVISVSQFLEFWKSGTGAGVEYGLPIASTWRAQDWRTGVTTWRQADDPSDVQGDGFELPIVCTLDASGADIFEVASNWLGSLAAWPGCMLIPAGWDRAGLIGHAWDQSPGARLAGALDAAMPSSLACGEVASFQFQSVPVSLDTCAITFVPGAVKVVITSLIILACGFAIWRRLTWSVGSG